MMSFTFRRNRLAALALGAALWIGGEASAQDVRVETQQQARTRAENALEDETAAPDEIADPELGDINLVSRAPRPKMFTFFTGQAFNFTSNAFLVRDNTDSDIFWNGRVGASFVPYATRDFTPRLTFDQNWFRYNDFGQLDFDAQNLQLDLKYDLNSSDTWYINGSYTLSRLASPDDSMGEFYRSGFLSGSITHIVQLGTSPVSMYLTGGAYSRHGDPSDSDRVAGFFNIVAVYNICETVQLSGFTRPEVQHYTHDPTRSSRNDFNLSVGAALNWSPREYFSVGATAIYVGNFSNVGLRDYNVVTPSVFVGGQYAF